MAISLMVAMSKNNVIGNNGNMLWHLPNDLKYFKKTTIGHCVIMGRKTFESLNNIPLPKRKNIVLTRKANKDNTSKLIYADTIQKAIQIAKLEKKEEVFIIGGGEVYRQSLRLASKIYLTNVDAIVKGNVYFPVIDKDYWTMTSRIAHKKDKQHQYDYSFEVWERIQSLK